jgi:glc operon protein GlcG
MFVWDLIFVFCSFAVECFSELQLSVTCFRSSFWLDFYRFLVSKIIPGGCMRKNLALITISLLFVFIAVIPSTAQLATKKAMTLEAAKKIAALAEGEAAKNSWTMVIVVVDDGGNLMYLARMDNTQIGSIEVAIQKAKTAILFKRPTKSFEERALAGRNVLLALPGAVPIEGGLPIVVEGQYLGAIGVSGGSSDQDGVVAKAALDAFLAQ